MKKLIYFFCVILLLSCNESPQSNSGFGGQVKEYLKSDEEKKRESDAEKAELAKIEAEKKRESAQHEANCQFEKAQYTVDNYINKKGFKIIETLTPNYSYGAMDFSRDEFHCSATYTFLVKELIMSSSTGNMYSDKIYRLTVTLIKYENYEVTSSILFDRNTGRDRILI